MAQVGMRWGMAGLVLALLLSGIGLAKAEDFTLKGSKRWVAVASTQDEDGAIGIARLFASRNARVVSSKSGWYGVIFGPVTATTMAAFRKTYQDWPDLPADARLSKGENFTGSVWQPEETVAFEEVAADKPAEVTSGDLVVKARLMKKGDNSSLRVTGDVHGKHLFSLDTASDAYIDYGSGISVVSLDPGTSEPQVVAVRNTGGAHCCTDASFLSEVEGQGWRVVKAQTLDGAGYWFEDLDGDGFKELMSADNSFLYTYDSYAGSFTPLRVSQFREGAVSDVTGEEAWQPRLRQALAGMEFLAANHKDLWHANGFLAAWVANKMQVGEGDEAWRAMLKTYDRESTSNPQVCETGEALDQCPEDQLKTLPFPEALAQHLKDAGYGEAPQ